MADLPTISKITLPSGTTYSIADEEARALITALSAATSYLGVTTTEISDGSTVSTITIGETEVTVKSGDIAAYGNSEYIWSGVEGKWREFGSTGTLKALAFKDSASASYTPAGSVSAPTVTVVPNTASIKPFGSAGTLPSCTLPKLTASVENKTLKLEWAAGSFSAGTLPSAGAAVTVATGIKSAAAGKPTFTGTKATITVK